MQTPHRFRTKRQLWAYCGLALKTSTSGEYRIVEGQLKRSKKFLAIRGLNQNHNHDLKNIVKGAATRAAAVPGPFQEFHAGLIARGMKPTMARLTLARRKVSDRTMVGLAQPPCLSVSGTNGRRYDSTMDLRERKTHSASSHYWGWTARPFSLCLAVVREVFV
jgi:hypothetical protein